MFLGSTDSFVVTTLTCFCLLLYFNHYLQESHNSTSYEPSSTEMVWNSSIQDASTSWPSIGCPKMRQNTHWETSHHIFHTTDRTWKIPIEPLVGTLRHPETACAIPGSFHRKDDWFLLPPHDYLQDVLKNGKLLLVVQSNRAAAEWLMDSFKTQTGFQFDDAIMPWQNHSILSPTSQDYVVAHLDDFSQSADWHLYDEVFVDHRTLGTPMVMVWGQSAARSGQHITCTYSNLLALRKRGIRAHAWA